MRSLRALAWTGLLLALAVSACSGTETGNPPSSLQLALTARSSDATIATIGASSAPLIIDEAWISLQSVELLPCAGSTGLISHDLPADLTADPPEQVRFDSTATEYCGLRVHVGPSAAAPAGFEGKSVVVRGSRSDGAMIELTSTVVMGFDLVTTPASNPFDARFVVLGFDVAPWFHGLDVQAPVPDTNGLVTIDAATNPDLLGSFDAQLGVGISLYPDSNHDGRLSSDETTPIAAVH